MASKLVKIGLPVAIIGLSIVVAIGLAGMRKPPEKKEETRPVMLVNAQELSSGYITYKVHSQGTVKPKLETSLISEVNGRIVKVADNFIEGGFFNEGDLLVQVEQFDYATALKAAEASLAGAHAALEEEKARGKVAEEEWRTFTSGAVPDLGLRRPQLASALAMVKSAEAELENARRNLARTEIRAPYSGMVKSRSANLGQFISRGTNLGVIYGTDVAEVRLPLTDNDLAFINLPNRLIISDTADATANPQVELTAIVAGKPQSWSGRIVRTEGVFDERSRVIYAVARIDDPYQRKQQNAAPLRFGRFVEAAIHGMPSSSVIILPRHLVLNGNRILVVDIENQLQLRDVQLERTDDRLVYVIDGFADGDRLITSAITNPVAGTVVRVTGDPVPEVENEQPAVTAKAAEHPDKE
ncbi:efflux RND transporter periplasmic adaptor subunit [Chromatiaceae bacterium AAb-1]|nr:efflux RND transporter periplasmic adaptor subunit [Chromatiaceae bacterium AAb-1]